MLMASRKHVRHNFDENRNAAPGSVEAHEGVAHAQATAQILRENVVQGESAGDQKYSKLRNPSNLRASRELGGKTGDRRRETGDGRMETYQGVI